MSLCVHELCHPPNFRKILAAIPGCRNLTGLSVLSWFRFYSVLEFLVGLGNNGSHRSIISSTCEFDTGTGWESIPLRPSPSRVSLSLHTAVVGEVDELEEDVG